MEWKASIRVGILFGGGHRVEREYLADADLSREAIEEFVMEKLHGDPVFKMGPWEHISIWKIGEGLEKRRKIRPKKL